MKKHTKLKDAIRMVNYGFDALFFAEYPISRSHSDICTIFMDPVCPTFIHVVESIWEDIDKSIAKGKKEKKLWKREVDLAAIKRVIFPSEKNLIVDGSQVKLVTIVMNSHKWLSFGFIDHQKYSKFRAFMESVMTVKRSHNFRL